MNQIRPSAWIAMLLLALALPAASPAQPPVISPADSTFLDMVQKAAVNFFWEQANASNGLIKDRSTSNSACSIASRAAGSSGSCWISSMNVWRISCS